MEQKPIIINSGNSSINVALIVMCLITAIILFAKGCGDIDSQGSEIDKKVESYQSTIDSLNAENSILKDSIELRENKIDTIIKYRLIERKVYSQSIQESKEFTDEKADSLFDNRFDSKKTAYTFSLVCDSTGFELGKEKAINYELGKNIDDLKKEVFNLKSIVIQEQQKTTTYQNLAINYQSQLKAEKPKKWYWGVGGFVGGFVGGRITR